MAITLNEKFPIAIKDHECMACTWILNGGIDGNGFSRDVLRVLAKARKNNWKILKGQEYIRQFNKQDGEVYTFKAIPEVHQICLDLDLYG